MTVVQIPLRDNTGYKYVWCFGLMWSWHHPALLQRGSFWVSFCQLVSLYFLQERTAYEILRWEIRNGKSSEGFYGGCLQKADFCWELECECGLMGSFLPSLSSPLPCCLYERKPLWLRSDSDALMSYKSLCSGSRGACHMTESLLSLVSSLPPISPCLLTSSDPLACVRIKWRKRKTSNWPSSTWQGDVARKKKIKKRKNRKPRGWLRDRRAEEKKGWRQSGRRQFYFPFCWFKCVERKNLWEGPGNTAN